MPPSITHEQLVALQKHANNIRNICILAHVDHGKTTLADSLIASNGIIAERLAGQLRYLDSMIEEQERGITMKSSSISLHYCRSADVATWNEDADAGHHQNNEYLINLIDSPGHVDFSTEVSTAVRLCDGALVVVDAVEGCSSQTVQVLRQAWQEKIKPVLIINKIDRLILETKKSAGEAYQQMRRILEDVNAVVGELFRGGIIANEEERHLFAAATETKEDLSNFLLPDFADENVEGLYFSPENGNVLFASAIDGWAFRISHFARLWASKLGIDAFNPSRIARFEKAMWGDYWLNMKQKRIEPNALAKGKKPLFEQLVLESIWQIYQHVLIQRDAEQIEKIVKNLGIKMSAAALLAGKDHRAQLQSIFRQWLPLSKAVIECTVDRLPSPVAMDGERAERLMLRSADTAFRDLPESTRAIKQAFIRCSADNEHDPSIPCIVYISKIFAVTPDQITPDTIIDTASSAADSNGISSQLDERQQRLRQLRTLAASALQHQQYTSDAADCDDTGPTYQLVAFARVFSGTIKPNQILYFLGPKHNPQEALRLLAVDPDASIPHATKVKIKQLFMLMGRQLQPVSCVPAGNICGIGGLEDVVVRSGTLSSMLACPAFTDLYAVSKPIVAVSVEPVNSSDVAKLTRGMRLLLQADPCVEAQISQSGEHVLITAGEVHLERCMDDLRKRYARIPLNVSEPSVPFRETIALTIPDNMLADQQQLNRQKHQASKALTPDTLNQSKLDKQRVLRTVQERTSDGCLTLEFEAVPIPRSTANFLDENADTLRRFAVNDTSEKRSGAIGSYAGADDLIEFKQKFLESFSANDEQVAKSSAPAEKPVQPFSAGEYSNAEMLDRVMAFGPKHCGSNLLVCALASVTPGTLQDLGIGMNWRGAVGSSLLERAVDEKTDAKTFFETEFMKRFARSLVNGFQLAAGAGPLCKEPLFGVCFMLKRVTQLPKSSNNAVVDEITVGEQVVQAEANNINADATTEKIIEDDFELVPAEIETGSSVKDNFKSSSACHEINLLSSGSILAATKEACQRIVQQSAPRLVVATYRCRIQAAADVLGKLYSVLSRRQGQILAEEMQEGTQLFNVDAELPVAESFGFAEEVRRRTSGHASAFVQLVFSHWAPLEELDPYWIPGEGDSEQNNQEDNSSGDDDEIGHNLALTYMNRVRRRKGLALFGEKLVKHAEKQRTLNKKK